MTLEIIFDAIHRASAICIKELLKPASKSIISLGVFISNP